MAILRLETPIAAPPAVCCDAARDMALHCRSAARTGERIVAGKTRGLLELGDEVTFEATHFGMRQRLTARITVFESPHRFVDEMVDGAFHALRHTHEFRASDGGTLMIDTMEWTAPLGPLGRLADALFLKRYMRRFLERRNEFLKAHCEQRDSNASAPRFQ